MSSNFEITKTCELCGSSFIARKLTTQYCSHQCSQRAYKLRKRDERIKAVADSETTTFGLAQKKSNEFNPIQNDSTSLNRKEFLNVLEASELLGVCRATINNYCVQGKLKCIKMNRKIFIRRNDIEQLFESAPPYVVTPRKAKTQEPTEAVSEECITEFYTADELATKFGYSKSAIHKMAASKHIPKTTHNGSYLYSKRHFDEAFAGKQVDESITEWYTVEQIMELYSMTKNSVYSLTSERAITKKNQSGKTLYDKSEIDTILQPRLGDASIVEWYTNDEIKDVYGFEPGYVASFVFKNKIPKKRIGNKGYYSKQHFDKAVAERKPSTEYITVDKAMELYRMSRDAVYACVKRHNIPKIKEGPIIKLQKSALEALFNPVKLYI
ncbi:transposase [Mucinivorans hirudinis]|uniref:Transposase n=1 Tax=Mucinivorans hirudinis TaxID=1433126 RepID=A0A060R8P1_9BACT|nr:transposase [Mucinivorans hirudinis]